MFISTFTTLSESLFFFLVLFFFATAVATTCLFFQYLSTPPSSSSEAAAAACTSSGATTPFGADFPPPPSSILQPALAPYVLVWGDGPNYHKDTDLWHLSPPPNVLRQNLTIRAVSLDDDA